MPARFEPIERAWVKVEGGSVWFDDLGQGQRNFRLMSFTHVDRDTLRSLYRHPVALEPITLTHSKNWTDAETHAFTRAHFRRDTSRPAIPDDRASVVLAWYADRAVPFPTLLEARDDTTYVDRDTASGFTERALVSLEKVASSADLHSSARQLGVDPQLHKTAILQMIEFLRG
jgi:hypothetical protein